MNEFKTKEIASPARQNSLFIFLMVFSCQENNYSDSITGSWKIRDVIYSGELKMSDKLTFFPMILYL